MRTVLTILVASLLPVAVATMTDSGSFRLTGETEVSDEDAYVAIDEIQRINIWKLSLMSKRDFADEHGYSVMVNLFFSRQFQPGPGSYSVQFHYLDEDNALGGSVIIRGEERTMYSFDTAGEAVFERFDDERISGHFQFETFDGDEEDRRRVEVTGEFDLARGDALKAETDSSPDDGEDDSDG